MELNFEQVNGAYVASVKVDSAYALHLERAGRCPLAVLQRHGEAGQYVPCPLPAVTGSLAPAVVDVALDHCVYPVEVKIVSGLEPHVSTLTPYAGGGGGGGIPDAPQDGVLYGRKDGTWSAVPDPSGDIADLQGRLDTAEGDIDALETSQGQQDGKITALEAADTALDGRLDALETSQGQQDGKITALEAADTALGERLTTAEGKITAAEGDIDALQQADTALGERLTAAEGKITAAEGEIDALQQADTALDGRLDALETSQGEQDGRLDALETSQGQQDGKITALEAADTALDGRLDALETSQGQQDGKITALEAADTALDGRLDALETSQGQQDGKITALEAADTALGERLTTAEGKITAAEGDIDALQQADTALGERLTAAEGKITAAEGEIDALQQADAGQDEKITALETADAAHDEAIGSLEQKVEGLEAGGGFPEAPQDGTLYGRKDGAWAAVPDPSGDIAALEGRMDTAEGKITAAEGDIDDLEGRVAELEEQGGGGGIPDAPQDGTLYGRKDGAWVPGMDYPSDDSFPIENEVYGRGKNRWVMVQMATNTALFGDFIRDFADIGFAGNYNGSYDGWLPMALYGISAYGLQSPSDQQKLIELYNGCLVFVNRGKYYILMGGCTEDTAELPVAYAVSFNSGEITITGVDVNAFPEAYRFRLVINSSGTITENTITQIQG